MTRQEIKKLIEKTLVELPEGVQISPILEKVRLQYPEEKIHKRRVLRALKELINDGTVKVTGYYVYSIRDKVRLRAGVFGELAFSNLWNTIWEGQDQKEKGKVKGKVKENLPKYLVEMFGIYMFYCFLKATYDTDGTKSFEDRMNLLRSMVSIRNMYIHFERIFRGRSTRDIEKWFQILKEQHPEFYGPLESSAETARSIVK